MPTCVPRAIERKGKGKKYIFVMMLFILLSYGSGVFELVSFGGPTNDLCLWYPKQPAGAVASKHSATQLLKRVS